MKSKIKSFVMLASSLLLMAMPITIAVTAIIGWMPPVMIAILAKIILGILVFLAGFIMLMAYLKS